MSWQRTDGTLILSEAGPTREDLIGYFREHAIPVLFEFLPEDISIVGLSILVDDDGRAAEIRDGALVSGLEIEDLAADIAERFDVGTMLGDVIVEMTHTEVMDEEPAPEPESEDAAAPESDGEQSEDEDPARAKGDVVEIVEIEEPRRGVTITSADDSYFPSLARSLKAPITTATTGDRDVVVTNELEELPGAAGWEQAALPLVQVVYAGIRRSVIALSEEQEAVAWEWGAERVMLPEEAPDGLAAKFELLDPLPSVAAGVAAVSATADVQDVTDALLAPAEVGPARLMETLGLSAEFADFLEGTVVADELPGARQWEPASTVQAVRAAVADVIDDAAESRVYEFVDEFDQSYPLITRTYPILEAAVGSGLFVASAVSNGKLRVPGMILGVGMLVDALADVALVKWIRMRRNR